MIHFEAGKSLRNGGPGSPSCCISAFTLDVVPVVIIGNANSVRTADGADLWKQLRGKTYLARLL